MKEFFSESSLLLHFLTEPTFFWIFAAGVIGLLFFFKKGREAGVFAIALILTRGVVGFLKDSFAVERPENGLVELTSYAFPSTHAALSMFLVVMLSYLVASFLPRQKGAFLYSFILLLPIALVIGSSRVVLGVHTWTDVLGGFFVGLAIPLLILFYLKKRRGYRTKRQRSR